MSHRYKTLGAGPLLLLFVAPLGLSLLWTFNGLFDFSGWALLFAHPQLWSALKLSLGTGLISTALSFMLAVLIVAGLYQNQNLASSAGAMLAFPHVAFAIGISFLIMPSGLIARLAAVLIGWQSPPDWVTTHDPLGLALILVLALKEAPFLIWILASLLNSDDVRRNLAGQNAAAASLGHDVISVWLRIFLPQILPRVKWPLLVIFMFAGSVVDVSLIIGPTQPPTLATSVWADLNDAQVLNNTRGFAGAWFLTGALAATAMLVWIATRLLALRRSWLTVGPATRTTKWSLADISQLKFLALKTVYITLAVLLSALSVASFWPFPFVLPETISTAAWSRVSQNPAALITSMGLAISTSFVGLAIAVCWLESQPRSYDRFITLTSALALGLPAILLSLGQYRAFLQLGLTGTMLGLFLAHLVPVTAYMFLMLVGPYRNYDARWRSSANSLHASFPRYFWTIKLAMLKAPLLAAGAVGFAVSFGQYLPAQLMAAGRFSTLPMEVVTLTSGSNRPLTAAFAIVLMLGPLLVFLLTSYFARPRWRQI